MRNSPFPGVGINNEVSEDEGGGQPDALSDGAFFFLQHYLKKLKSTIELMSANHQL